MKALSTVHRRRGQRGQKWTYVVHAEAMIRDPGEAFRAKRALELGQAVDPAPEATIVGRCAEGTDEDNLRALEAAAAGEPRARPLAAGAPQPDRYDFNARMAERVDEFVEILMAEGHPRRLAQWEAQRHAARLKRQSPDGAVDRPSCASSRTAARAPHSQARRRRVRQPAAERPGANAALGVLALAPATRWSCAPRAAPRWA